MTASPPAPTQNRMGTLNAVMALRPGECKWPVGELDSAGFHFCTAPADPGQPYCPDHARIACAGTVYRPKGKTSRRGRHTSHMGVEF